MDPVQMENVLTYIRGLLQEPVNYRNLKKEAMKEIRQALENTKPTDLPLVA